MQINFSCKMEVEEADCETPAHETSLEKTNTNSLSKFIFL